MAILSGVQFVSVCMHIRVAIAEVGCITDHGMVNAMLISSPQMTESCRSCQCGHVFEDTKQIAGRRFSGMNCIFPTVVRTSGFRDEMRECELVRQESFDIVSFKVHS